MAPIIRKIRIPTAMDIPISLPFRFGRAAAFFRSAEAAPARPTPADWRERVGVGAGFCGFRCVERDWAERFCGSGTARGSFCATENVRLPLLAAAGGTAGLAGGMACGGCTRVG